MIFGFLQGQEILGSSSDVIRDGVFQLGEFAESYVWQFDWEVSGVVVSASCPANRIRNHLGDKPLAMIRLSGVRRSSLLWEALFCGWFPGRAKWKKATEHSVSNCLFPDWMQCGQLPHAPATMMSLPWWTASVSREPIQAHLSVHRPSVRPSLPPPLFLSSFISSEYFITEIGKVSTILGFLMAVCWHPEIQFMNLYRLVVRAQQQKKQLSAGPAGTYL